MTSLDEFRFQRMADMHLEQVAKLHEACFQGYYLTRFGPRFLEAMYGWYVTSPEAIAHVALDPTGEVVGFVAGTSEATGYHRSLFRHQVGPMLASLLRRLLSQPVVTLGLVWERRDMVMQALPTMLGGRQAADETGAPAAQDASRTASLVSIGTDRSFRRQGIAQRLTELFLSDARDRGNTSVTLSVREDNVAARRFYESLQWEERSRSSQPYHGSFSITYEKSTRE
jgi:ribosomal protein S18 acetylase RimI-like enzyme